METGTVLQIIAMLDTKAARHLKLSRELQNNMELGKYFACRDLSDHLQSYIEAQLSAAEIQTGE
jgi:hypothetical protein